MTIVSHLDPHMPLADDPRRSLLRPSNKKPEPDPGDARCGVLELADAAPAAAFVGATAGAHAVADVLRFLHEGQQYAVLNIDLRSPSNATAAFTDPPQPVFNPGYARDRSDRIANPTRMDTTQVAPIVTDPE